MWAHHISTGVGENSMWTVINQVWFMSLSQVTKIWWCGEKNRTICLTIYSAASVVMLIFNRLMWFCQVSRGGAVLNEWSPLLMDPGSNSPWKFNCKMCMRVGVFGPKLPISPTKQDEQDRFRSGLWNVPRVHLSPTTVQTKEPADRLESK